MSDRPGRKDYKKDCQLEDKCSISSSGGSSGTGDPVRCSGRSDHYAEMEASGVSKQNDSSQMKDLLRHGDKTHKVESHSTSASYDGSRSHSGQSTEGEVESQIYTSIPLTELKKLPSCHVELERLSCSKNHTVLVNVDEFHRAQLVAQNGQPKWNSYFVKMPYSGENVIQSGILQTGNARWEGILKYLSHLPKNPTSLDVEYAIKRYNPKYKRQWSFDALHSFYKSLAAEEQVIVSSTLYKISELALKLPVICNKAIPLLRQGQSQAITLSQIQIACLLANAFYCTFPHRNTFHHNAEYSNFPTINFSSLFGDWSPRKREKLKAIFNYFRIVTDHERKPHGLVTFERCSLHEPPQWSRASALLTKLYISSEGTIEEEGQGMLQVDFACSLVGGGVLGNGLVQEEILFLCHPELIVSRLFTERLDNHECLRITGLQRYNTYTGFSDTFVCVGFYMDHCPRDEWLRHHRKIVAIDALNFKSQREQYNMRSIVRELNKAYCGFQREEDIPPDYLPAVATGNWGCGAFKGDLKLKGLIQLMAAAVAQRDVAYFTFHNKNFEVELLEMYHFLIHHKVTVGRLFDFLNKYCNLMSNSREPEDLFKYIRNAIIDTTCKH